MGTILQSGEGRVLVLFPASGETRQYAEGSAPLKRVVFRPGDTIHSHDGVALTVSKVMEKEGLLVYLCDGQELPEAQLSDSMSFSKPQDRLLNGQVDDPHVYDLRVEALERRAEIRRSPIRGYLGGRVDLIPHQLYIAKEVTSRSLPRVLLSDEVGLGKTIEACLILHRLLLSGEVERALILVPDSLVHQWFVEMYRRFHIWFSIYDAERCDSIAAGPEGGNPFLDEQLILCGIGFLAEDRERASQLVEAGWDMVVIDEAHHLEWSPEEPSAEYQIAEGLSRVSTGLLLLTATPEQLGVESHFARLRLLDADRYPSLEAFQEEAEDYQDVAVAASDLLENRKLSRKQVDHLVAAFQMEADEERARIEKAAKGDAKAHEEVLEDLLDRHGPGRVLFRNTRAAMKGFPKRIAELHSLEPDEIEEWRERDAVEFACDCGDSTLKPDFRMDRDPRVQWVADFLSGNPDEKVLLICRTKEKAIAVEAGIQGRINVKSSVFHEDLNLVQRDRNAAWFADKEGAQVLICSEIGSEGRNFQFAHHLVLFDLPLNPELLEQRIGRLDRIGQTSDIHIHIPFVKGSAQEALARWLHEGIDGLQRNVEGGAQILKEFGQKIHDAALEYADGSDEAAKEVADLVEKTRKATEALRERLHAGRDRLLELNSYRPKVASRLVKQIEKADQDRACEAFMLKLWDHFGIHPEDLGDRTYQLGTDGLTVEGFPGLPKEGMVATFKRAQAISVETTGFITWDHPMVTGSMDLMLSAPEGNSSFAHHPDSEERGLVVEAVFVLECVAPGRLHSDRFLPPTPIRILVDQTREEVEKEAIRSFGPRAHTSNEHYVILDNAQVRQSLLPAMIETCEDLAEPEVDKLRKIAATEVKRELGHEINRLKALQKVNPSISDEEIEVLEEKQVELLKCVVGARPRLDAVRVFWLGDLG